MATEFSGYFDSTATDVRDYNENDLSRGFRVMCDTGVATLAGDNLRVLPAESGLRTRVGYGGAMVRGFAYELIDDGGEPRLLEHTSVVAYPRIDRVVLRLNLDSEARYVALAVVEGAEAADPQPPALTRTGTLYEISLAQCRVNPGQALFQAANITDERDDDAVCGNIRGAGREALQALALAQAAQGAADTAQATADAARAAADAARSAADAAGEGVEALKTQLLPEYLVVNTLPATVTPRTIVVLSDTTTGGVSISEEEPSAAEGLVWIQVVRKGSADINTSGSVPITVRNVLQYSASNGWKQRNAYFEYLGEWVQFHFYDGFPVFIPDGGVRWVSGTSINEGDGTSTPVLGPLILRGEATYKASASQRGKGCCLVTADPIDITPYTTLKGIFTAASGNTQYPNKFGIFSSQTMFSASNFTALNAIAIVSVSAPGTVEIDVSAVTGSYYVGMFTLGQPNAVTGIIECVEVGLK